MVCNSDYRRANDINVDHVPVIVNKIAETYLSSMDLSSGFRKL